MKEQTCFPAIHDTKEQLHAKKVLRFQHQIPILHSKGAYHVQSDHFLTRTLCMGLNWGSMSNRMEFSLSAHTTPDFIELDELA